MAIRKLYGNLNSLGTLRALVSIYDHELDVELIPIDLKSGENQTEAFLSLNVRNLLINSFLFKFPVAWHSQHTIYAHIIAHAHLSLTARSDYYSLICLFFSMTKLARVQKY